MRLRDMFSTLTAEWMLLGLVTLSILWKGGKTLEMTWLLALVAVALCVFDVVRHRKEKKETTPGLPWIFGLLFIAWTVVSFVWSSTMNYGLDEVLRDTSLFLIFLWSLRRSLAPVGDGWEQRVAAVIVTSAIIACIVGIAVYALQPVNRFVGTFVDPRFASDYWPNAWAEFLLLALPLAMVWARGKGAAMRILIPGILLGCLFLSYSRGAFLCFIGEVMLLAAIAIIRWWRSTSRSVPWKSVGVTIAGIALTAVVTFSTVNYLRLQFHAVESIAAKATFTASEGTSSIDERREFWDAAFQLASEKPILGWGPYSFRFVQPRLQTSVFATSDHPHNVFLKLAMERGWPAAILFSLFLLSILLPAGAHLLVDRKKDARTHLRIAFFIGVLGVLAHNEIDYNLQFVGMALPFWILLGCVAATGKSFLALPRVTMRTIELLIAFVLLIVTFSEGRLLVISSLGRHAEAAGKTDEAYKWYSEAEGELFSRDMYLSAATIAIESRIDGNLPSAGAWLKKYAAVNAQDTRAWKLQGDVALANGKLGDALHLYDVALKRGRYNYLSATTAVVRVLQWMGDNIALRDRREEFMKTYADFGDAILVNTHFIALSNTVEEFLELGTELRAAYPSYSASIDRAETKVLTKAQALRDELGGEARGTLW